MEKIPSVFMRNYETDRLIRDEVVLGCEWVLAGEGIATRKWDGTSCLIRDGKLYKRYDVKKGKQAPPGFEEAQEPDLVTGHHPGWLPVSETDTNDRWHREASLEGLVDGTYELVGPKVNGNADGFEKHVLVKHGAMLMPDCPRTFEELKKYLSASVVEGIVFHHPSGKMAKVKTRDFGFKWPPR